MTAPDASTSGDTTAGSTPEAPSYTSPTEQLQEAMARLGLNPAWGFKQLFEKLGKSSSGGSGGQFEFSPAEMRTLQGQFRDEADALDKMREESGHAANNLQPLADDPASRMHYKRAREHFKTLQEAIEQQYKFASGFSSAIDAALEKKTGDEESIGGSMRKLGSGLA
jgi:hypothetical protein